MLWVSLVTAPLWQSKGRLLLSAGAIMIGVALGLAVNLINRAAIDEMGRAVATLSGEAELTVRGPRSGFDESLYPQLALRAEVRDISPAIEVDARLAERDEPLRIVGVDAFRAASVQPKLLALPFDTQESRLEILRPDALFLSPAAARWLSAETGSYIGVQVGTHVLALRVAGVLSEGAGSGRFALMDIGAAQQAFKRVGVLTRLDLDLHQGIDSTAFLAEVAAELPQGTVIESRHQAMEAHTRLTRAYRVNLNVLALVALFTGGLLVFSTQAASIVRRQAQLALLRVIGLTRNRLLAMLLAEGAIVGVFGAVLGLTFGVVLADAVLRMHGADLGADYFRDREARLHLEPVVLSVFGLLGVLAAVLGTIAPALDARRIPLARTLRSDGDTITFARIAIAPAGLLCLAAGTGLVLVPAIAELPVGGYAAIALIMIGSLLLMPRLIALAARALPKLPQPWIQLATARLHRSSGNHGVGLAALVASVSLAIAMAIMVASFRVSLDQWLEQVLPADLYVRAAPSGDTAYFDPGDQARIAAIPGVRRADFLRAQHIVLDPGRPRVTLLARDLSDPARQIPLVRSAQELTGTLPKAWVSEYISDVLGWQPDDEIVLPLAGKSHRFVVAGVWRDYARQNGAVVIERYVYRSITQDDTATDVSLWLAAGSNPLQVREALGALPGAAQFEIADAGEIREWSLSVFDRTFAVTYALEAVAIFIGLAGLSASLASNAFARRREFGMLRHIGMTRRQIGVLLAWEGFVIGGLAALAGLALGWVISLLLVHVVNRQSFHWSMNMHYPVSDIALFLLALITLAVGAAVISGRAALSGETVRAVKEDW